MPPSCSGNDVVARRDDAAGRGVGQRLEREQRALDQRGVPGALVRAAAGPFPASPPRSPRSPSAARRRRERAARARASRSAGTAPDPLRGRRNRPPCAGSPRGSSTGVRQRAAGRARPWPAMPSVDAPHPGHDRAVVEPHDQLHAHRHRAALADHHPEHVGRRASQRHQVDDGDGARLASRTRSRGPWSRSR